MLLAAATLAGCGGPSDAQQVRQTVVAFGQATARKDFARICNQIFAPKLVEQLQQVNLPCPAALQRGFGALQDVRLTVGAVQVNGDKASAEVRTSAAGQQPSQDKLELIKLDGHWRISALAAP
jgi:hypothetical protein